MLQKVFRNQAVGIVNLVECIGPLGFETGSSRYPLEIPLDIFH